MSDFAKTGGAPYSVSRSAHWQTGKVVVYSGHDLDGAVIEISPSGRDCASVELSRAQVQSLIHALQSCQQDMPK